MKRLFLPGIRKHLLLLGILAVYSLSANTLFARLFVHHGRPEAESITLPAYADGVITKVGYMRATRVEGEDVFELQGFAFMENNPTLRHRIRVVLQSDEGNLVFATEPPTAPAMIDSSSYHDWGVEHSEFRAVISKYAVPPGTYQVGLLLDQPQEGAGAQPPASLSGPRTAYALTGAVVIRTPNTFRYNRPPDPPEAEG